MYAHIAEPDSICGRAAVLAPAGGTRTTFSHAQVSELWAEQAAENLSHELALWDHKDLVRGDTLS